MLRELNKIKKSIVFKENTFLRLHITNACIPSSVKAHPQLWLCPILVPYASHPNKDESDPVFEAKLLLFLLYIKSYIKSSSMTMTSTIISFICCKQGVHFEVYVFKVFFSIYLKECLNFFIFMCKFSANTT